MVLSRLYTSSGVSELSLFYEIDTDFEQNPPPKPLASLKFMAPLITHVQTILPSEYQLPLDIRTFFKDGKSLLSWFSTQAVG